MFVFERLVTSLPIEREKMPLPKPSKSESIEIERWLAETSFGPMSWGPKNKRRHHTPAPIKAISDATETYVPEPVMIDVSSIHLPEGHREVQEEAINGLRNSIQTIGLQHPITVSRRTDGGFVLIAGRHRLEAYRQLGFPRI